MGDDAARQPQSWGDPFSPYTAFDARHCSYCEHVSTVADGSVTCALETKQRALDILSAVYGGQVTLGRCEQGDSLVRRSELFMSGQTQARSLRRCHLREDIGREVRYIGYAELRAGDEGADAPIASALLKLPLKLLRSQVHTFPLQ